MKTDHPGFLLRQLRNDAGLRLRHINEATGISISHLSDVERGKGNVSFASLVKWAEALGYKINIKLEAVK